MTCPGKYGETGQVRSSEDEMPIEIGQIEAIFRYPVKSMRGEPLEAVTLGWHGLDGDRRLAFRRAGDRGGFPWLSASKLPELILFAPQRRGAGIVGNLPTHVRTPEGEELAVFGQELATEVGRRHGSPVEMEHLNRGIFDEASVLNWRSADKSVRCSRRFHRRSWSTRTASGAY